LPIGSFTKLFNGDFSDLTVGTWMMRSREGSRDIEEGILLSTYPDYCRLPNGAVVPYMECLKQKIMSNKER